MPMTPRRRPRAVAIAMLVLFATLLAAGTAELVLRLFKPGSRVLGKLSFATEDGTPITPGDAIAKGRIIEAPRPWPMDRQRTMFAPDQVFYLCYTDNDTLRRDWLDP